MLVNIGSFKEYCKAEYKTPECPPDLVQTMKHHMENLFLKGTTGGQESKKSSTEELSVSVDFFTTEKHGPGSSLLGHISDVEVQQYLGACHSL